MQPLSKKITGKMIVIYLIIYISTLLLIFALVRPRLEREADSMANAALSLMSGELENVQNLVTEYSKSILYSKDIAESLKAYDADPTVANEALVNQLLSSFVVANAPILTASLEDFDHHYFHALYFTNVCNQESAEADVKYQELIEAGVGSYYLYVSPEEFDLAADLDAKYHALVYTQVIRLNQKPYIFRIYGRLNTVINHFAILKENVFSDIAILYADGKAVYLSGSHFAEESDSLGGLFSYQRTSDRLAADGGVYFYQKDVNTRWILLGYSPIRFYDRTLFSILSIVTLLYLISAVIYTIFLVRNIRHFLLPLEQLNRAMQDYSAGEQVHTEIHTQDEIEKLNGYFLEMTEKINQQVEDIKEQEHVNSVVNYKLLATQIDPHFIYNTMNIINIILIAIIRNII